MKKLLFLISVLLFNSCAYFNTYYNAKKYYGKARKESEENTSKNATLNELKFYELTIEKCKAVVRKFPDSRYVDDSLLLMAKSYYYMGDYENSKINLEELLRRYPGSNLKYEALLWSGRAAWNLGQYTIAEEGITRVLNETDDKKILSAGYEMLAEIYRDKNEQDKELEYLEKIKTYSKNDQIKAKTVFRIGIIQKESGLFEESIKSFQKVEEYLPSPELVQSAKLEYTRALKSTGRTDDALDVLQAMFDSQRFKKIRGIIEIEFADISYREGDIEGAIERYGSIGIKYPRNIAAGRAWKQLGDIYMYPESETENIINYHYALEYYKRAVKSPSKGKYKEPSIRNKIILEGLLQSINKIEENKVILALYSGDKEKSERMLHKRQLFLSEVFDGILPAKVGKKKVINPGNEISNQDTTKNTVLNVDKDKLPDNPVITENLSDSSTVDSTDISQNKPDRRLSDDASPDESVIKKSLKNQKTPGELIKEIVQHKYLIAEYYYLDLAQPDSSKNIFLEILSEYKDSDFAPKSALSLGLLNETVYHDSSTADSFYNIVVNKYPNSPSSIEVNRRLKRSKINNTEIANPANELYEKAYYEGFINKNRKMAYALTNKIQSEYPSSDVAARAAFLKASIVDQSNHSPDSSLSEYNRVIKLYPETIYAIKAKENIRRIRFLVTGKEISDDDEVEVKKILEK